MHAEIDVQTLFFLTLFTLGLPTACILLCFVNGLINGSGSRLAAFDNVASTLFLVQTGL